MTALEIFVDTDFDAVQTGWKAKAIHIADPLSGIPGVRVNGIDSIPEMDDILSNSARAQIEFGADYAGPSVEEVIRLLEEGDPGIRILGPPIDYHLNVMPVNLVDGEEEIVARRLREILTSRSSAR